MRDHLPLRRRAERIATNKPMFVSGEDLLPKNKPMSQGNCTFLTFANPACKHISIDECQNVPSLI